MQSSSNAGFFLLIDLRPWLEKSSSNGHNWEFALAERMLDAGVGLHPGEEHAEEEGQFRLVFTQDRKTLTEGLRRYVVTSL
jgi:1-aminocyclopropane-1-carboxylate synthase